MKKPDYLNTAQPQRTSAVRDGDVPRHRRFCLETVSMAEQKHLFRPRGSRQRGALSAERL